MEGDSDSCRMRNQPEPPDRPDANCAPPKSALMMPPTIPPPSQRAKVSYPQSQKPVKESRVSDSRSWLPQHGAFAASSRLPIDIQPLRLRVILGCRNCWHEQIRPHSRHRAKWNQSRARPSSVLQFQFVAFVFPNWCLWKWIRTKKSRGIAPAKCQPIGSSSYRGDQHKSQQKASTD